MIRKLLIPALALTALGIMPAHAEEQVWRTGDSVRVRAADLDLFTPSGRAALLQRVEFAAAEMCREVTPRVERETCAAQLVERAIAAGSPTARAAMAAARTERVAPSLAGR